MYLFEKWVAGSQRAEYIKCGAKFQWGLRKLKNKKRKSKNERTTEKNDAALLRFSNTQQVLEQPAR